MKSIGVTRYSWPASLYLDQLHHAAAKYIKFHSASDPKILDFGCGYKRLSQLYPELDVIGYDINPSLSDLTHWDEVNFDIIYANQVFYSFSRSQLIQLLSSFIKVRPQSTLIVGISRQGLLNKIGMSLLGYNSAHNHTQLSPSEELATILQFYDLVAVKSVACLSDLYILSPRQTYSTSTSNSDLVQTGQYSTSAFASPIPRGKLYHSLTESLLYLYCSLFRPLDCKPTINKFEKAFAAYTGSDACIAFPLARTGIYFALKYLCLPTGSYVLMPAITIKGILEVVLSLGLKPLFVDSNPNTLAFNEDDLRDRLMHFPVKAAIITPLFGVSPDVNSMLTLFDEYSVFSILDFSQCLNSAYSSIPVYTKPDASVYSASSIKTLDTLGGGLVITSNSRLASYLHRMQLSLAEPNRYWLVRKAALNLFRSLCVAQPIFSLLVYPVIRGLIKLNPLSILKQTGDRSKTIILDLPPLWFTSYTSLQASIGLHQLPTVSLRDAKRRRVAECYRSVLASSSLCLVSSPEQYNVYWQFPLKAQSAQRINSFLARYKVDTATTSLSYLPSLISVAGIQNFPNAKKIHSDYLFIPCYPSLSESEKVRILLALSRLRISVDD